MKAIAVALLVLVGLSAPAPAAVAVAAPSAVSAPVPAAVSATDPAPGDSVSVTIDRSAVDTQIGQRIAFTTSIRNDGNQPVAGLVAHLNILSADADVYVDPEDWSTARTVYPGPIPAHSTTEVPWTVQAVNDGHFLVYVAVTTRTGPTTVAVSDGLRLTAAPLRTINAGGVLPVVLGVPIGLLLLAVLNTLRRRRRR